MRNHIQAKGSRQIKEEEIGWYFTEGGIATFPVICVTFFIGLKFFLMFGASRCYNNGEKSTKNMYLFGLVVPTNTPPPPRITT